MTTDLGRNQDGAIAETTPGGRSFPQRVTVIVGGRCYLGLGLESFFGMKREEGGRGPPQYRVSQGRPSRGAWVAFALLRAHAPFPPAPPPTRAPSGSTRVGEARARLRSRHPPPAPAERAREGWRAAAQARRHSGRAGPARGLHDGGASGRRRRRRRLLLPPAGLRRGPRPDGAALVSARPGPSPAAKGRRRRRKQPGPSGTGAPEPARDPTLYPARVGALKRRRPRWEAERAELQGEHRPGPPAPARPARPSLTRRRRRRHLGAMAAGTAGGRAGTATGREPE